MLAVIASAVLASNPAAIPGTGSACESVWVYRDGRRDGERCGEAAQAAGMTVLQLGDPWAPYPFDGAAAAVGAAPPAYSDTLVALADQRFGGDTLAAADHDLELYGVGPSARVVLAAMDDDRRHRCHDAVDDQALRTSQAPLRREDPDEARARRQTQARRQARLAAALKRRGWTDPARLAALGPVYVHMLSEAARGAALADAIAAVQGHLVCEALLPAPTGNFDHATTQALTAYQRRHWIVARGEFDVDTREAMLAGSRELDLRRALRLLRERVTDAAGLITDGSARYAWGTVLGRQLDPADLRYQGVYPSLSIGAPDAVAAATDAAARALGWLDFAAARGGLRSLLAADAPRVALTLPPSPAYREVRAVIDRDPEADRAVLTLYAHDGPAEVALVRWPTTVGGWKDEKSPAGAIVRRFKPSDVGPRVWRDLVVAPVWYAPASTPDADLVGVRGGHRAVKEELIGPGYRSAYGLVMLIHHQPVMIGERTVMLDRGIRTHGSVSYHSILVGDSHGCHRLYNHHALRLANFLLRNHAHIVHGAVAEPYDRRVKRPGRTWYIHRDDRGFRYELTPPIPIDVRRSAVR